MTPAERDLTVLAQYAAQRLRVLATQRPRRGADRLAWRMCVERAKRRR